MARRRTYGSYNDGCAAAHALDLVGDRWTMVVVRELLLGPKRFGELQRDIIGIGPTVLTRRLHDLVAHGLAVRRPRRGLPSAESYELTDWGYRLEDVNTALAAWAVQSPSLPWEADMSPDTLVLTMRAHARPCPDLVEPVTVALRLTDSRQHPPDEPVTYDAEMSAAGTTVVKGNVPAPAAATLSTTTRVLKTLVLGTGTPAEASGMEITGDPVAVQHLLDATRLLPSGAGSADRVSARRG